MKYSIWVCVAYLAFLTGCSTLEGPYKPDNVTVIPAPGSVVEPEEVTPEAEAFFVAEEPAAESMVEVAAPAPEPESAVVVEEFAPEPVVEAPPVKKAVSGMTKEEYMAAQKAKLEKKGKKYDPKKVEGWFNKRDTNGDGIVTKAEGKAARAKE